MRLPLKNIRFLIAELILFLVCVSIPVAGRRLPETVIKIGLYQKIKSFNLSCEGNYYLYELNNGNKLEVKSSNDYLVRGKGSKIKFNGEVFLSPVRIVPKEDKNRVRINGRRYRDSIIIISKDSKLAVINELGLDGYLYGILPREVSPSWPAESLKAQAIVSRTYAMKNLKRHGKKGFDLCNTVHCQVYGGVESEDERTNKAVRATRGKVIVYKDKLASGLFHADCAGHTENPNYVWSYNKRVPKYHKGRKCRFCKDTPHSNWSNDIKESLIRKELAKEGYNVGTISKIKKVGKTSSGRVKLLKIKHSKGTIRITAARFRLFVSPWLIKSAYIDSIKKTSTGFKFTGRGWGHGVGMCQWGAKGMAEKGFKYRHILKYYFPGIKIEKWED